MIHEKTTPVYRDVRLWLVLASFLILAWLAVKNYPM